MAASRIVFLARHAPRVLQPTAATTTHRAASSWTLRHLGHYPPRLAIECAVPTSRALRTTPDHKGDAASDVQTNVEWADAWPDLMWPSSRMHADSKPKRTQHFRSPAQPSRMMGTADAVLGEAWPSSRMDTWQASIPPVASTGVAAADVERPVVRHLRRGRHFHERPTRSSVSQGLRRGRDL
eukprot:m.172577 g.172577  ORF g.172577 m.172577 type:complete len:182 (+) comp13558_c0_seq1:46-591(+)